MSARTLWRSIAWSAFCLLAGSSSARASTDERTARVEVRVVARVGEEIYLDTGGDAGLETGDRVRLEIAGAAPREAVVVAAAASSSRARLEGIGAAVEAGARGFVLVPAARIERKQQEPSSTQAPASGQDAKQQEAKPQQGPPHPGWSAPPEEWNQEMPLLAPLAVKDDEPSAVTWRGHTFLDAQATFDDERDYALARAGVDLEARDLFTPGGRLELDIEGFARNAELSDGQDEDDARARIDRLSYLWGGDRERPDSFQVGRFQQGLFPELGVIDGGEWTHRFGSGDQVGVSAGALPEWTPEMETGDDLQVAAGWRHRAGSADQLALGLAVQKTWHEGEEDRDLALGTVDWRPDPTLDLHGAVWVDWYGSDELERDSGAELTEAHLVATKRLSERGGFSVRAMHVAWPDLLRTDYPPVESTDLEDLETSRVGASAWRELARKVRLSGRVDWWGDEEDDGLAGELRLGVRDRILEQGELAVALFASQGKYSSLAGGRLEASRAFAQGWWTLAWDSSLNEIDDFEGEHSELWQHALRASYDRSFGESWDLGLWGDQRFGDEQGATTAGVSLRRRF
jgi:hypothetical protein